MAGQGIGGAYGEPKGNSRIGEAPLKAIAKIYDRLAIEEKH